MKQNTKVFFDFDGTLTTKDSLLPFIIFVVGWPVFLFKLIRLLPLMLYFAFDKSQRGRVKNRALNIYFAKYSTTELDERVQQYIKQILPTMMRAEGMRTLQQHLSSGHECILVSASIDLYLRPWAEQHGFSKVISTPFIGTPPLMMGKNCYGEEKVSRILAVYPDLDNDDSYAYGDTVGDIPMLKLVKNGAMWSNSKQQFEFIHSHD